MIYNVLDNQNADNWGDEPEQEERQEETLEETLEGRTLVIP